MRLIICGNGFDIHHNLKTRYSDYRKYLEEHASRVLKDFETFQWLNSSCKGNLWSDLEKTLALDFHNMIDIYKQYYCEKNGNDEYKVDFAEWTRFIYSFTGEEFYKWISSIEKDAVKDPNLEGLFNDSVCITFNYTDTIECLYNVSQESVLHIHGSLSNIRDDECFDENILLPFSSVEEAEIAEKPIIECDKWNSDVIRSEIQFGAPLSKEDEVHDIFESVPNESIRRDFKVIVEKTTKKLYNNIDKLCAFLRDKKIDEVIILGSSLSGADEMYYSLCLIPMYKDSKWIAYVYSEEDRCEKENFFNKYGLIPEYRNW